MGGGWVGNKKVCGMKGMNMFQSTQCFIRNRYLETQGVGKVKYLSGTFDLPLDVHVYVYVLNPLGLWHA